MFSFIGYDLNSEFRFLDDFKADSDVEFYVDSWHHSGSAAKKVFIQCEPFAINYMRDFLRENQHNYDAIVCHDASQLSHPLAITYCPAGTWIAPCFYESVNMSEKKFQISHMSGYKDSTTGHRIRRDLYMNQMDLAASVAIPFVFYRSWVQPQLPDINGNPFIPETIPTTNHNGLSRTAKVVLFTEFQFSIVVENTSETNYFSEKLLDCLLMKTIPIYYGCPNISDFFDTRGWIIIETTDSVHKELQSKLSAITETYHAAHQDIIEKNYAVAKSYASNKDNLRQAMLKIPFLHVQ